MTSRQGPEAERRRGSDRSGLPVLLSHWPATRKPAGEGSRPGRLIRDFQQGTVLCGVPETPDGGREKVRIGRREHERGPRAALPHAKAPASDAIGKLYAEERQ